MANGGKRLGAGRPRQTTTGGAVGDVPDVLSYLVQVALGDQQADAIRVAAAKAALPYVATKQRAPLKSLAPKQLQAKQATHDDDVDQLAWQEKANAIREVDHG
jgi:hypothetical protein